MSDPVTVVYETIDEAIKTVERDIRKAQNRVEALREAEERLWQLRGCLSNRVPEQLKTIPEADREE